MFCPRRQPGKANRLRHPAVSREFIKQNSCLIERGPLGPDEDLIACLEPDALTLSQGPVAAKLLLIFREILANIFFQAGDSS